LNQFERSQPVTSLAASKIPLKPPSQEVVLFLRNLLVMLQAGVSLPRCLQSLKAQTQNRSMQNVLERLLAQIEEGKSLSQAFHGAGDVFDPFVTAFLKVGEESNLLAALEAIAIYYEKRDRYSRKVSSVLVYPALVLSIALVLLVLISSVCSRMLLPFFQSLHLELGLLSRVVLQAGVFFGDWRFWLAMVCLLLIWIRFFPLLRRAGWRKLGPMTLRWRFVRALVQARFARSFGMLVGVGNSLVVSLGQAGKTVGHSSFSDQLGQAAVLVVEGEPVAKALVNSEVFEPLFLQLVDIGEESGTLEKQLLWLADTYEMLFEERVDALLLWMEPGLMAGLGLLTGAFIFAVGSPLAQVMGKL